MDDRPVPLLLDWLGKVLLLNLGLANSVRWAGQQVPGIFHLPSADIMGSCLGEHAWILPLVWQVPY